MGIAMSFGVGGVILLLHPLAADFKIDGNRPLPALRQGPVKLALPVNPTDSSPVPRPAVPKGPSIAFGFGRDVPLDFAVRQVAPRWVHVSYGDSVDRQVRVSWHGGRPWNQVLGGVLMPLGLHMKMSGRTLWIHD
jgi:hypothetical protein